MKLFLSCIFIFLNVSLHCQDLFIRSYQVNTFNFRNIEVESFADGSYVIAGYTTPSTGFSHVFIKKFNACGIEVWTKDIVDTLNALDLTTLNIDSNQNIIVVGRQAAYNLNPTPFIVKFNQFGRHIYTQKLSSVSGKNCLIYSSSISPNGDINLFGIYNYSPSPPNTNKYYIARIAANGNLKWVKIIDVLAWVWGKMLATKDGGCLIKFSNTLVKVDSLGNKVWAKDYSYLGSLISPTETDSGYVFARYFIGGIDRGNLMSFGKNGDVQWVTNSYFNFFPTNGITRKNGNLIYSGSNHLNGNSAVFLETDFRNGNTIRLKEIANSINYFATDVCETQDGRIIFAGEDNRGFVPQIIGGKLNDTLAVQSCTVNDLPPTNDPYSVSFMNDNTLNVISNNDLQMVRTNFMLNTPTLNPSFAVCTYTKPRGSYLLREDTVLCKGEALFLGNNASDYDAYLWSTGSTNKTIMVNQSGIYWLQVIAACDTLRDSIQIDYSPSISFRLGSDTTSCKDSLILGHPTDSTYNYLWSTGAISGSIVVKSSGLYWLEITTTCDTVRDSIQVFFQAPLPPISLGVDTTLCPGETLILGTFKSPYESYLWSTGETNKVILVNSAGTYWLQANSICNQSRDSINIYYYPPANINLGRDTSICEGTSLQLKPEEPQTNYRWSTTSTDPFIYASTAGIYWLESQTQCGILRDSITIDIQLYPVIPNLGKDTTICYGALHLLEAITNVDYNWSTKETSSKIWVGEGIYWLEYYNKCDTIRDSIRVRYHPKINTDFSLNTQTFTTLDTLRAIKSKKETGSTQWRLNGETSFIGDTLVYVFENAGSYSLQLTITDSLGCRDSSHTTIYVLPDKTLLPTVFTPNSDGINDWLRPINQDLTTYEIKVYNRWGELIFSGRNSAWNGKNKQGENCAEGTYIYHLTVTLINGSTQEYKGSINLLR